MEDPNLNTPAAPSPDHADLDNTIQNPLADSTITCYVMKTKTKNVVMQEPVINITSRNGYMAQGHDGQGNKCVAMLGKDKALAAIAAGTATKGTGWPEDPAQ